MRNVALFSLCALVAICLTVTAGCGRGKTTAPPAAGTTTAHTHSHDHGHVHGPHGGHVVELDNWDYHAELTNDSDSHLVGVYLLGDDAATAAPVDAKSIKINVSVDGQTTTYELPAVSEPGDLAGKASHFELVSEPLETVLSGRSQSPDIDARLSLMIDGESSEGIIDTTLDSVAHSHSHSDDDALMWRQEVADQGYQISLGHHGISLLAGGSVEPAVQINRDGKPVSDAQVFNSLLAADGGTVLAKEVGTVYEPPTNDEPSHYAQGALKIPSGTREAILRFRVILPEGKGERTFDVPVTVK